MGGLSILQRGVQQCSEGVTLGKQEGAREGKGLASQLSVSSSSEVGQLLVAKLDIM